MVVRGVDDAVAEDHRCGLFLQSVDCCFFQTFSVVKYSVSSGLERVNLMQLARGLRRMMRPEHTIRDPRNLDS